MKTLISIIGPTAVGKTALSLILAKKYGASVISADSRQVYRGMDIGTGKIMPSEMGEVPHYFIDELEPDAEMSAGKFGERVDGLLEELFSENDWAILAGGSGFYFQAVWEALDEFPELGPEWREGLIAELDNGGLDALLKELEVADPETWEAIDRQNPARVLRALEIFRGTGKPISSFRTGNKAKPKDYQDIKIGLSMDRTQLYDRINLRVDQMLAAGLLAEVSGLWKRFGAGAPGLRTVGYREFVGHFEGKYDLEEAIRLVKRNTRRLAKRQLTWFRRFHDIVWFEHDDFERIIEHIEGKGASPLSE